MKNPTRCYLTYFTISGTIIDTLRKENEALHGKIRLLAQTVSCTDITCLLLVDILPGRKCGSGPTENIGRQVGHFSTI